MESSVSREPRKSSRDTARDEEKNSQDKKKASKADKTDKSARDEHRLSLDVSPASLDGSIDVSMLNDMELRKTHVFSLASTAYQRCYAHVVQAIPERRVRAFCFHT